MENLTENSMLRFLFSVTASVILNIERTVPLSIHFERNDPMDIIIGEKLRALRREKDMTQAELAEKLNVSVQAISKWERNEGYPDITMLPHLARFFDVSIDELMGMGKSRMQEKINAYKEKSHMYRNQGETEKVVALWEKALEEFPADVEVKTELMNALFSKDMKNERIITLGEELLNEPKIGKHRDTVVQILTYVYNRKGDKEKAREYAGSAHSVHTSREYLLVAILDGEEGALRAQWNIENDLDSICRNILHLNRKLKRSPADCVHAWETCIKLFETVFEDGDYGFYACRMADMYLRVGAGYCKLQNAEKALDALEKSAKFSILYDTAEGYQHTSPLVDLDTYDPKSTAKNSSHNDSYETLETLQSDKTFDCIRGEPRFEAILAALEAVAQ